MGTTTTLRTLRGRRGMSQRQLATLAGLNITTIVDLEAGRTRRPQVATVGKLADALGVPIEVLLDVFDERVEASA